MNEPRRDQSRPNDKAIQSLWQTQVFTHVEFSASALDDLLGVMRGIYTHGGVAFAMFSFPDNPTLYWFISRNNLGEIAFLENLLCSAAFRAALPDLESPQSLEPLKWDWSSPYILGGDIAIALMYGGAYGRFSGSGRDAKNLGERACEALFGDRFEDVLVYKTTQKWSDWFSNIGWDSTWIGIDKAEHKIWVLCISDTD